MGKIVDSSDMALWDGFNADLAEIAGTDAKLYSVRPERNRDVLYSEPIAFEYDGPYEIMVTLRQPERKVDVTERGKERIETTQIWFSRAHLEDRSCPVPKEGDVLEFWGGQYDLEEVKDESHVPTDPLPYPIQFVLNAKRRERFLPERKTGSAIPGQDPYGGIPFPPEPQPFPEVDVSMTNIGGGAGVYAQEVADNFKLRSIRAGDNVTIQQTPSEVVISAQADMTSAENIGDEGLGVFAQEVGADLQFRKLKAGSNVNLEQSPSGEIVINANDSTTAENIGDGLGVFSEETGDDLKFRKLRAGENISLSQAPSGEIVIGSAATVGVIFIGDVAARAGGAVSTKVFMDPPGNTILQSCISSTREVTVAVRSSHPQVEVGGVAATLLPTGDHGSYAGQVDVTLAGAGELSARIDQTGGATTSMTVELDEPPQLLSLAFSGSYPGSQTELKAGDTYRLVGTTDKPATGIELSDYGAAAEQTLSFPSGTSFLVTFTVASRGTVSQLLAARGRVRNAAGAFGPTRDTNQGGGTVERIDLARLNNLAPTLSFGAVAYPPGQGALKGSEQATVAVTFANADLVIFDSPNGQLDIADPTIFASTKTATRIGGTYNASTANLRAVVTRVANGAQLTAQAVVKIAAVAPTIVVSTPAARLRSGGNNGTSAQNHTVTLTSDQELAVAPVLSEQSGRGTFTGAWSGGPTTWTRVLQVHDDHPKGLATWQGLTATNRAGLTTTVVTTGASYTLGGFVSRTLTFAAFSQQTSLGTTVTDYSKLSAGVFTATNQAAVKMATLGDHANTTNRFTVDALSVNPATLWWNDQTAAGSNSGGTAQITLVQEAV